MFHKVFLSGISSTTSHWRIKGEYVCLEAAKNVTYDPLCASNGQTYQNYITFQCFIRYFNVHGLTVRRGACFRNPEPDHCVLSFVVWRRVCGTDNVTYSSVWELLCEARRQNKGNAVQYEGPCRIQCPMSLVYKPVCSSENVVYPNLDALRCTAMREPEKNITKKKDGVCGNSQALSICLPSKYSGGRKRQTPVCASNGVTYASYNALACLRLYNRDLRILHDGPCQYRDVVISSDDNKVCNLADNNAIMMPVCGTDNVTYPNPFILRCAAYRGAISSDIEVEHEGACDDNLVGKETPDYEEDPCQQISNSAQKKPLFCASDGRSYYSAQEYACAVKANSDWFHYTIIKVGASCEKRDSPCEKLQVLPEALQADPICGSDGTSYINPLALMCAMTTEPKLKKHHKGPCI